jgi:hypothetical protein
MPGECCSRGRMTTKKLFVLIQPLRHLCQEGDANFDNSVTPGKPLGIDVPRSVASQGRTGQGYIEAGVQKAKCSTSHQTENRTKAVTGRSPFN